MRRALAFAAVVVLFPLIVVGAFGLGWMAAACGPDGGL